MNAHGLTVSTNFSTASSNGQSRFAAAFSSPLDGQQQHPRNSTHFMQQAQAVQTPPASYARAARPLGGGLAPSGASVPDLPRHKSSMTSIKTNSSMPPISPMGEQESRMCRTFALYGTCRFGASCRFGHTAPVGVQSARGLGHNGQHLLQHGRPLSAKGAIATAPVSPAFTPTGGLVRFFWDRIPHVRLRGGAGKEGGGGWAGVSR